MTASSGDKLSVEYVESPFRDSFFAVRELREYGRVWNLSEDEAVELYLKLGKKLGLLED